MLAYIVRWRRVRYANGGAGVGVAELVGEHLQFRIRVPDFVGDDEIVRWYGCALECVVRLQIEV